MSCDARSSLVTDPESRVAEFPIKGVGEKLLPAPYSVTTLILLPFSLGLSLYRLEPEICAKTPQKLLFRVYIEPRPASFHPPAPRTDSDRWTVLLAPHYTLHSSTLFTYSFQDVQHER